MIKCHYCEFSQMRRGEIHCPCDGCVMPKAEIEKLNGLHKRTDDINRIKSEAIKGFAERVKITDLSGVVGEHYINGEMYGYFDSGTFGSIIDNLVKEMVGDLDA